MQEYTATSYDLAKRLTNQYSTSFSMSSRLFDRSIQRYIYAIYAMVRLADEIVDTYRGDDANEQLGAFQREVFDSMNRGFSTNPFVHAFADTARRYGIDKQLITPFFTSMRSDLSPQIFDQRQYEQYIYGSAEVVGLMCLRVFVDGDQQRYDQLQVGARALGAAYQKVNFLRDIKEDYEQLGRVYFPGIAYDAFDDTSKRAIVETIEHDFAVAESYVQKLPQNARRAVATSYAYYDELLARLKQASATDIKARRIRVPNTRKVLLYAKARTGA